MAEQSRIDADDEWFVGEDRVIRFTFTRGDVSDITEWNMVLELFARRAADDAVPLVSVPATGFSSDPAVAVAVVPAADSIALGPGVYQFVLRRRDEGSAAVLSYGPAELRSAVNA